MSVGTCELVEVFGKRAASRLRNSLCSDETNIHRSGYGDVSVEELDVFVNDGGEETDSTPEGVVTGYFIT